MTEYKGPAFSYFGPREIRFYRLSSRFVDSEHSMPDKAKDIIYYNLAVGHHSGVMDCFKESFSCSEAVYDELLDALNICQHTFFKLSRLYEFAEIELRLEHGYVWNALSKLKESEAAQHLSVEALNLLNFLSELGADMRAEAGLYLMVRSIACQQ